MKKLLITAVAAALATPTAWADTVNVNVYGRLRAAVESINGAGAPAGKNGQSQLRLVDNSSVLGFKGAEDLGDGYVLNWQAEGQLEADGDADGKLNSRNTFIALKADWGTLLLGKNDTPYKLAGRALRDTSLNDTTGELAGVLNRGLGQNFYTRQASTLQYHSPKWAGFDFKLGFAPDEAKTAAANKQRISLSAGWENEQLLLSGAWEQRSDVTATDSADALLLVAGYKFGAKGTVSAGFERISLGDADQDNVFVAGRYKLSDDFSVSAHVGLAGEANDVADTGATLAGVGAQYDLSRRTSVSAYFTQIRNDSGASYNFNDNAIDQLVAGNDPRVFGLGINHVF